jgi:hypothetical protein
MSEDVKVARREINGFIASKCLWQKGKVYQVLQAEKIL